MKNKIPIIIIIAPLLLVIGFIWGLIDGHEIGYEEGQLDYQRGIIRYELTENGYKEFHNE